MPRVNPIKIVCIGCGKDHLTLSPHKTRYCSIKCARKDQVMMPHREESKKKIRESNLKTWAKPEIRSKLSGKNNPMFGRDNGHTGQKHHNWKGNEVSYHSLHQWVNRALGKPTTCQHCKLTGLIGKKIHWSNISGEYRRDTSDWQRLCAKCHKAYDMDKLTLAEIGG